MADATAPSSSPRSRMKSDKCVMPSLYVECTIGVKGECASDVLYGDKHGVHDAYMTAAKEKIPPRPREVKLKPTFVRQWRMHRGVSQEELAERVGRYLAERGSDRGYTHASIGRIENGKMAYTQPVLEAIAEALQTDVASLLIRSPVDESSIWAIWDEALPSERRIIEQQADIVIRNRRRP